MKRLIIFLFFSLCAFFVHAQQSPVKQYYKRAITGATVNDKITTSKWDTLFGKIDSTLEKNKVDVNTSMTSLNSAINNEATIRASADVTLQNNINAQSDRTDSASTAIKAMLNDSVIRKYSQMGIAGTMSMSFNSLKNGHFGSNVANGWYGLIFASPSDLGAQITLSDIGSDYQGSAATTATMKNGHILMLRFRNNSVTHFRAFAAGWHGVIDSLRKAEGDILNLQSRVNRISKSGTITYANNANGVTWDFENADQKNMIAEATTAVTSNLPVIPVNIINVKDEGKYTVILNGSSVSFLSFPSNVFRVDGTQVGTYNNDAGAVALKFFAVGGNLYMED
jgi:hypothetical protein